jgi:ectoine hydroxylase
MKLTPEQLAHYEEKGYLLLPDLFSAAEVDAMKAELARFGTIDTDAIVREKSGAIRTVFRVHDKASPTYSAPYWVAARVPRMIEPMRQILGDDHLYMYHSKLNLKEAIDGAVWQWHQDYGYWEKDGTPTANLSTACIILGEASEMSGCLYFIPGSHKVGKIEPDFDVETTSYGLWKIPREKIIEQMEKLGDPIPMTGPPGTTILFHPQILHGSGHNMGPRPRWQIYFVYNTLANRPAGGDKPRPEYVCSRLCEELEMVDDGAVLAALEPAE